MSDSFFGKFRGIVTDNRDPLMTGRVRARVPDLGDLESGWATPCAPFGGSGTGMFALPPTGASVWVEFEHGNPDHPVWSGSFWQTTTEVPPDMLTLSPHQRVFFKTAGGHSILVDDTPGIGGITLKTSTGQKIVLNAQGIEIDNGMGSSIKFTGPQVSINGGALEVT